MFLTFWFISQEPSVLRSCCRYHYDPLSLLNTLVHMASSHVTWACHNMAAYHVHWNDSFRLGFPELLVVKIS